MVRGGFGGGGYSNITKYYEGEGGDQNLLFI